MQYDLEVDQVVGIRIDGLVFPVVNDDGEYLPVVRAAQCNGYEDAIDADGELCLGAPCLSHIFILEAAGPGHHYVCAECNEPYTIRLFG